MGLVERFPDPIFKDSDGDKRVRVLDGEWWEKDRE